MTKKTSAFLRFAAQAREVFVTQDIEVFTFLFSFLLNPNPRSFCLSNIGKKN